MFSNVGYFIQLSAFVVNVQKVDNKVIMTGRRQRQRQRERQRES